MHISWTIAVAFGAFAVSAVPLTSTKTQQSAEKLSPSERAERVKSAFLFAYHSYEDKQFGHDELRPVSGQFSDSRNGWGATIFDALDTLHIMDLDAEYERALKHVASVNWSQSNTPSKTFETNIRYLGGLLSAYDLKPNQILLEQAVALTEQVILPSFNTNNKIPTAYVDVNTGEAQGGDIILAEFGSLQLELVRLSQLTGNEKYGEYGLQIIEKLSQVEPVVPGLYPMIWDQYSFTPVDGYVTISGGADSFYEYLLKTHLLMDGNEVLQLDMWSTAVDSMQQALRSKTSDGHVYLGELKDKLKLLQTGELICFLPGNILMGARYMNKPEYEEFAKELMDGCYHAWETIDSGLAPESWSWVDERQDIKKFPETLQKSMQVHGLVPQDLTYDLRPETLESLFYFYRITGDTSYQDKAWNIFQSIEKYCKVKYGYSRVNDVTQADPKKMQHADFQESYLFAETFKYLYLIFSDPGKVSLDEYVFNTEAHPMKLPRKFNIQKE